MGNKKCIPYFTTECTPYFTSSYKITGLANRPVIIFQVLLNAKALTSEAS